ncbi:primase-helicase family protein [Sphingobacterium hotanense]|uniref:primase-helicase family protein n=1 Tax=Sphingobacterium hotanense TaxID=649196 RepID=UPI0011F298D8|nr:primase-helicase family protein [Sphingobacterium hotanense]
MQQYKITKEDILLNTNGGLDIFRFYIPDIDEFVRTNKHFTDPGRYEKTPSSKIKRTSDGNYIVNDFGHVGKWMNAIAYTQVKENCEYGEAIKIIAERHGIGSNAQIRSMYEADVSSEDAKPDQPDGEWTFNHAETIKESHLRIIFSERTWSYVASQYRNKPEGEREELVLEHFRKLLLEQHWHVLDSYTIIKDRKAITFKATEFYPIFRIEEETKDGARFSKIYLPKSKDKGKRFYYHGKFDAQFLHGYAQVKKAYEEKVKQMEAESDDENDKKEQKLDEIIYCTGGSDALNFRALGYHIIYPSSEHFKLTRDQLFKLFAKAKSILTCPDLDYTGQMQNHRLCLTNTHTLFLDIKTIELPLELQGRRDQYGRPCKDLRDYMKYYSSGDLSNLIKVAKMYRFWDETPAFDRQGNRKERNQYELSIERVLNFLVKAGFGRRKVNEETIEFIQIDGNLVRQVKSEDIKAYLLNFLRSRFVSEHLLNVVHKSTAISANSFDSLPMLNPDFRDYDPWTQYMFFENTTWKITARGIDDVQSNKLEKMVWESKILKKKVRKLEPMFTVNKDDSGRYSIDIKNQDSMFFRFLIQTSRVHWRKELEDNIEHLSDEEIGAYRDNNRFNIYGPNLTQEDKDEQALHLINKMYCFGYMMHRYKAESRPWIVYGMDDTPQKEQGSFGGTGKSIFFKGLRTIKNLLLFDGKNVKLFDDNHVFEQVTTNTDTMYIDDADRNFPMERVFSMTTGDITVNPKGKTRTTLPFSESPKLGITTNFAPDDLGPSLMRRILFFGTSNYYHVDRSGMFRENRQPVDDFGKELWAAQYTDDEWNLDLNFMAQCCQLYLSWPTWIEAPMKNIMDRAFTNSMGFAFLAWAEVFFTKESGRLDCFVPTQYALEDYKAEANIKTITSNGFNSKMKLFAQLKKMSLNPKEVQNNDGRVTKTWDVIRFDNREKKWIKDDRKKTQAMIYLQSDRDAINDIVHDPTISLADVMEPIPGTKSPGF